MAIAASSTSAPGTPTPAPQQLFPRAELLITETPHGFPTARSAPSTCCGLRVTKAIRQGIAGLTEMAPYHHFAQQALNIIRYLAKKGTWTSTWATAGRAREAAMAAAAARATRRTGP